MNNYINTLNQLALVNSRLKAIEKTEFMLKKEKENLKIFILDLKNILKNMEKDLKELEGIENKLYSEIVIKGISPTRAVYKIAIEYNREVSTIWKHYYPKVKNKIDKSIGKRNKV